MWYCGRKKTAKFSLFAGIIYARLTSQLFSSFVSPCGEYPPRARLGTALSRLRLNHTRVFFALYIG